MTSKNGRGPAFAARELWLVLRDWWIERADALQGLQAAWRRESAAGLVERLNAWRAVVAGDVATE